MSRSSCRLLLFTKATTKFNTKFGNIIDVSDVKQVTDGEILAQTEHVGMTTVMLHMWMHPLHNSPPRPGANVQAFENYLWYAMKIEKHELDEK